MSLSQYKVIFSVGGMRVEKIIAAQNEKIAEKLIESQYPGQKIIFYSTTRI